MQTEDFSLKDRNSVRGVVLPVMMGVDQCLIQVQYHDLASNRICAEIIKIRG